MNATDHRAAAEQHLKAAVSCNDSEEEHVHLQYAQVHATLASTPSEPGPPWSLAEMMEMAAELRKLRAAVREANLHQRGGGPQEFITLRREQWNKIIEHAYSKPG